MEEALELAGNPPEGLPEPFRVKAHEGTPGLGFVTIVNERPRHPSDPVEEVIESWQVCFDWLGRKRANYQWVASYLVVVADRLK